jgi:hypothetical protein
VPGDHILRPRTAALELHVLGVSVHPTGDRRAGAHSACCTDRCSRSWKVPGIQGRRMAPALRWACGSSGSDCPAVVRGSAACSVSGRGPWRSLAGCSPGGCITASSLEHPPACRFSSSGSSVAPTIDHPTVRRSLSVRSSHVDLTDRLSRSWPCEGTTGREDRPCRRQAANRRRTPCSQMAAADAQRR